MNESRLLLGMFRRVIEKSRLLELVGEMVDLSNLREKIAETHADLVIINNEQNVKNLETIDTLMNAYPSIRFLTVAADGSQVSMKSLRSHEQNLTGLSLAEILNVIARPQ